MEKSINIVYCEDDNEYKETVSLLCRRYKDTRDFKFREISGTIITFNKKWIVAYANQIRILIKNSKVPLNSWNAKAVKSVLIKEGKIDFSIEDIMKEGEQ